MDDLAGLNWPNDRSKAGGTASAGRSTTPAPNYSPSLSTGMRPSPAEKPPQQKDDPFGELVSFTSSSKQTQAKMSLRERQQILEEQSKSSRAGSRFNFQPTSAGSTSDMFPTSASTASGKDTWNFDALDSIASSKASTPKSQQQQARHVAGANAMDFDPLAATQVSGTKPSTDLLMDGFGGQPTQASTRPSMAAQTGKPKEPWAANSDDEPIPMDPNPPLAASGTGKEQKSFVDNDFEIAQIVDYGFTVEQAQAALEITGSPRAAIQLLREQTMQRSNSKTHSGKSRLRTPYRDDPDGSNSSSDDDDGAGGFYYDDPRKSRNRGKMGNTGAKHDGPLGQSSEKGGLGIDADSLLASANELGTNIWNQANSWFAMGKKKFMEVQESIGDSRPGKGSNGGWARPDYEAEYMGTPSRRYRDDSSSSEEDTYVSANRRGKAATKLPQSDSRATSALRSSSVRSAYSARPSPSTADSIIDTGDEFGAISKTPVLGPQQSRAPSQGSGSISVTQKPSPKPAEVAVVPEQALVSSNAAKTAANEKFKLGQFGEAIAGYTQAISHVDQHSGQHPLLILLYNNRALAYVRDGEASKAVVDCSQALQLCLKYQANGTIDFGSSGRVSVTDQRAKALQRRAEAYETSERYNEGLSDWKDLREAARDANSRTQAVRGIQRCEKVLGINQPTKKPVKPQVSENNPEDIADLFASISMGKIKGGGTNILNQHTENSPAVAEMRRKEQDQRVEDDKRLVILDQVEGELSRWRDGKQQNLRALLSSVHTLLPEFPPIGMHEIIEAKKVKRVYMRTIARLHPDKLGKDTDLRTRMVSSSAFSSLNEAWDAFKTQEGVS
ncbi:auxilin-like clathrin-binding protein required for normal clathrin function [Coemansia guatemalensis]|uniref:Auxilin-like clathrin-binding protein required for normal clathrin function n=1 Tax=Coemansia guatemalensis TaxID=2761395 RepID=A0A9W8HXT2_9FUNG|nr:auxilin-like clathrin-binding protein required for normal clathrin function [Coemansia guatemalensis]